MFGTQLRSWLKLLFAGMGGFGLFLSAFVDSSFLPLPLVSDLLLMELSSRHPARMPYYATMAALGSLGGCIWIYWLARKGGEAFYRRTQKRAPGKIQKLLREYPLASVFLPAVAPFPVPFKPFVIAQGAFQVPFGIFVVGTLAGRGLLFFFEGFLGARYGESAKQFLVNDKWVSVAVLLMVCLVFFVIRRLFMSFEKQYSQAG